MAAPDQAAIIDRLVELQATHGNITDKEAYKKALYAREAEGSTYVDNGITVPHAKTNVVTRPSLAALRLSSPVQYNAEDDGTTDLLFAIAAPEDGGLHVDMLARMMQMLMNEDFVEKLRAAKTPAEFLDAIDAQEEAQFGDESFTQQQIPQNGYRVLAVTACPTGIAHTYMAAAALVDLKGGTAEQCAEAFAMALTNLEGLVCDPVAGLVEIPCVKRNVIGAMNAVSAADMALAGVVGHIPADEVIDAMAEGGNAMSKDLRETGIGGLAGTPTGCKIAEIVTMSADTEEED